MHKLILFVGICFNFATGSELPAPSKVPDEECGKIIGCYYTINLPRDKGELLINDIDVHLCTHVFYTYVGISANATVEIVDPDADIENNGYKDFNNLKKKNPKLKTLASMQIIGPRYLKNVHNRPLTDPDLREKLVNNIVNFVKKYGFNGVDINYSDYPALSEYPLKKQNKKNFVLLLKALRERFDKERLILSVQVDPKEELTERLYDIKGISTYVDFINLKTFNFHADYNEEKNIGHTSPLYHSSKQNSEERKNNIDYVVKYWISQFAPPSKLILGTTSDANEYTLGIVNAYFRTAPFFKNAYVRICDDIKNWTYSYDEEQQVPYIHRGKQIIAYDDVRSIRAKALYADKMHLGGAMMDSIDNDDHDGHCGEKFALLKTLNRVLRNKC